MRTSLRNLALALIAASTLRADEGMWTFDNLPAKQMKAKYGFAPDQAWLDHVRLSTVRFPEGTGSLISADGLVITNHHVGHDSIQLVSDKGHDYVKNGFLASTRAQEIRIPELYLDILDGTENVTAELDKAVKPGAPEKEANEARERRLRELLDKQIAATGLECEPVQLYQGGEIWIYRYRRFKDVRLVMAPEYDVAAFGKDWDNFSYPRHDLDFSIFRIYENGQPFHPAHHLAWSRMGAAYGDLTFVTGHPGTTSRLETFAQMMTTREVTNPIHVRSLDRMRKAFHAFAARGEENARQVSAQIMTIENSYKVYVGEIKGLKDEEAMARVKAAEDELKWKVALDPQLQSQAGASWGRIEEAMAQRRTIAQEQSVYFSWASPTMSLALGLVRLAEESAKPASQRSAEFASNMALEQARKELAATHLEGAEVEALGLEAYLENALVELGPSHAFVQAALKGRTPEEAARVLVAGSRLREPGFVKSLLDGGSKAILESPDAALSLARALEPLVAPVRAKSKEIQAVLAEQGARIANARFKVYGKSVYPDATFTLRLSFGAVETYPANGTLVQPFTTFGGMYDRADAWGEKAEDGFWALPPRWKAARKSLDLSTPYNFITSNDITGGNSGSPVINRKGELVGLAFDGNIESLPGAYYYDGTVNRCVCVDVRAIRESLMKVYNAKPLVDELGR